ncbi:hypothetical protein GMRT_10613 [Giardia muris]|uniref:Uncharacterized protein n=1 Tax=Giardia muris TaxID=5742 RepID=A0A4Z1ST29_GIAMU|nr:hypothetical protein GMRT_10613 [Giardia muris]|eukprot:TNJ26808.1 hypothetical protein GMRT_10613 [Giardia muris]
MPIRSSRHAPLPARAALSSSPALHSASRPRTSGTGLGLGRPPSASYATPSTVRKAPSHYRSCGVVVPKIEETLHIRPQTSNIQRQVELLRRVDAENADSTRWRMGRAIKAGLLPSALLECAKDEPYYAYLLTKLAEAVDRYMDPEAGRVDPGTAAPFPPTAHHNGATDAVSLAKLVNRRELEGRIYRERVESLQGTLAKLDTEIQVAETTVESLRNEIRHLNSVRQITVDAQAPGPLRQRMLNVEATANMLLDL